MSKKIKKTVCPPSSTKIVPLVITPEEGVSFSFKYYRETDKFSVASQGVEYFQALLNRCRDLSKLTVKELVNNHSKSLRCHPIRWEETTEAGFGLPFEEQYTPFQLFEVSLSKGRVHGFFVENVAYIVWLDPYHRLYK